MKKICLTLVGIYLAFVSAFSQESATDTSGYKSEKLKVEEVNLVTGYYSQNGNHSAVTGGIGTQQLTDFSNVIDLKLVKWNLGTNKKYNFDFEAGIDHHTAASQAYISKTGASSPGGTRFYPSGSFTIENENKSTFGMGLSISREYNYHSFGLNFQLGKKSANSATEVNFKGQLFLDNVSLIMPSELNNSVGYNNYQYSTYSSASRGGSSLLSNIFSSGENHIPTSPRNTYSGSLTISQIVNRSLQFSIISDLVVQSGLLSLPFHRVYFKSGSMLVEKLPDARIKIPIGLRMNYFMGDNIIFRTYYRFYKDDWGIMAHTASLEVPYKLNSFFSLAPFTRLYSQQASKYFAPYKQHASSDQYYTSNYDLSKFNSKLIGLNIRFNPPKGDFIFDMVEVRFSHYLQSTGLNANNVGLNLRFK